MSGEKRRGERLTGRFEVVVREKLATWSTFTEDVSDRGCRIELKRPLSPGMLVQLTFGMGPGVEPLVVHGQVAWARRTPPHSAGIAFLSVPRQAREAFGRPGDWIDRVLRAYVRRMNVVEAAAQTPAPTPAPGEVPSETPTPGAPAVVARLRPAVIVPPSP